MNLLTVKVLQIQRKRVIIGESNNLLNLLYSIVFVCGFIYVSWERRTRMKKTICAILLAVASPAFASPYFVPNPVFTDPAHPVTIQGALIDPRYLNGSRAAIFVPTFMAKGKLGEDWTPCAVGGSMNAGKVTFDIAPLANVAGWAQQGLLAVIPPTWAGVRSVLASQTGSVSFSGGPVWEYRQRDNKGYFMVFSGLALTW